MYMSTEILELNTERSGFVLSSLLKDKRFPLEVRASGYVKIEDDFKEIKQITEKHLLDYGAILFRDFKIKHEDSFIKFVQSFGYDLLNYEFGSTPRTSLGKGVYTTTEYPSHQVIPQHNEQSYTLNWPMKIWLHCVEEPEIGGATPLSDSREVYKLIDPFILKRFAEKKLMYVRNYGGGLDLPWQQTFNTESRQQVENFCHTQRIEFKWKDNGDLRTSQVCQAVASHPITNEMLWFNQAHLFHISNLAPATRDALLSIMPIEDLPRNVYYGDGSPIEYSVLQEIREVLDECTISFPWKKGDILMLDNMLIAHGRSTFKGTRKVIVAMAEPNSRA